MENLKAYTDVFVECFGVMEEEAKKLTYQSVSEWDSVGHMNLIASLEDTFDIMMDTDDIIEFNSFEKGLELLKDHYHITF